MTELTIGLIFGGQSGEHQVSIASARAVNQGLNQHRVQPFYIQPDGCWANPIESAKVLAGEQIIPTSRDRLPSHTEAIDLWFPVLHGPYGEDGTVQGLLELLQKPYIGNGVLASALGMDKILMKSCFAQAGLAQVKYLGLNRQDWRSEPNSWSQHIETHLGYPCFVKPSNLGSSVGISKVRDRVELVKAVETALGFDSRIIIEQGVTARELECAVLGNEQPQASVVGEITFQSDFYDYETKYTPGRAELIIPANLPTAVIDTVQDLALRAFRAIAGQGLARVDFFYVPASGMVLINEINTMPGFTVTSMYPKLWQASGLDFNQLCDRLIELALAQKSV